MAHYNLDMLKEMAQGNMDFVNNMVSVFLEHTPQIVQDMKQNYSSGNLEAVGALAHQIKPSVDLMGIAILHDNIRTLEKKGKGKDSSEMDILIDQVSSVLENVFEELASQKADK